MKKLLFILLFIPFLLQAQTTYYIDPGGNDGTGTGTIGNPWKSLFKACNSVSGSGDIIHVNAGTYTEINQCVLDPNVSIEGASEVTSIIKMQYANSGGYEAGIVLVGGSNTSQHIRNITLDGDNLIGYQGIAVYQRSHVSIYSCIIKNFFLHGVLFGGVGSHDNMFYSNVLTNCGGQPNHTANLKLAYQTNFSCHDNTITQTARGVNDNGNCVADYSGCYGMKFYNNVITAAPYLNDGIWKFAIEIWLQSGLEMYGNTIKGEIDLGKDVNYGAYPYGIYFHGNTVGWDAVQSVSTNGIQFEQTAEGVIVCNNVFKNLDCPIWFCQYHYADDFIQDVWIYSNLLYNCGKSNASSGWGIRFQTGSDPDDYYPPTDCDNINIWNNTIVAYSSYPGARGIELPSHATSTTVSNIDIKNNIIVGFSTAGITARQQDNDYSPEIDGLVIADNILYGNGNSNNALFVGFTPSSYTNDGGIKSDPSFVSSPTNLHLNAGSPAIGAGTAVTPPYDLGDYDGTAWATPPSIGAYEYVGGISVPTVTTSAVTPGVTTASGGGNVTSAGGGTVSERGIAYGAGANPTIAGSHTSNGSGTGVFTSALSGLTASTIYHVRAYATNEAGTAYGADVQFTTNDVPSVYHGLVKSANRFIIYGNRLVKVE